MQLSLRSSLTDRFGHGVGYWVCVFGLFVSLVFGGGTRQLLPSDFVCQLAGVVLLAVALSQVANTKAAGRLWPELALAALLIALPLVQLVPLPPSLWTHLPGREALVDEFRAARGVLPWQPISLAPDATWQAAFCLLTPLAVFISVLLLTFEERRSVSLLVLLFGGINIVLALLQMEQGEESPLRFYTITNVSLPVGLFANRNHLAAFLYCLLPLSAAWTIAAGLKIRKSRRSREFDPKRILVFLAMLAFFGCILVTQGLVRSRAGLLLTALAATSSLSLALPWRNTEIGAKSIKWALWAFSIAALVAAAYAFYAILQHVDKDSIDEARFTILRGALRALWSYFPTGSGFGTFDVVYRRFEQPKAATGEYINRAHDDFVEALIEGGVFAAVFISLFAMWIARRVWDVWAGLRDTKAIDASLARAGAFIPLLLILHSFADYPLRTVAMMSILAFGCALMVPPINEASDGPPAPRRERRTHRMRSGVAPVAPGAVP